MTTLDRELAACRAMTIAMRTAAGIMASREEAADIAQDVALDALRALDRLRDPAAFDAWVRRIAVRHTLRALRKQRSRPLELPVGLTSGIGDLPAEEVDRDLLLAARGALAQALTTLPPRQRVALTLRYVHDLPDREIAEALGCRRGTVNALLSRARATLRQSPSLNDLLSEMETAR